MDSDGTSGTKQPEHQEGSGLSVVDVWDSQGPFKDAEQSAAKFREFLERLSRGPARTKLKVAQLVAVGASFARAGRSAEALLAGKFLRRLYPQVERASLEEHIAKGLVSIGSELLNQGLRRDAVSVFDAAGRLLRDAKRPALEGSLALALFERGFALKEEAWASDAKAPMEGAVAAFSELENRFGRARRSSLRKLVALGIYNKAGALGALGRLDEAVACFASVTSRYGRSRDAALREVATLATIRERMMLAIPDPPPYLSAPLPAMSQFWVANGVDDLEQVAWFVKDDPDGKRAMIEARQGAAIQSHRHATRILMQYQVNTIPFALFLRSFDSEGFARVTGPQWPAETGLEPHVITVVSTQTGRVEQEIARALDGRGSVLTVANRDSLFESAWIIPRLFLPDDGWREVVEALVRTAHFIVIEIEAITSGVRWELECIEKLGRARSTLVVLASTRGEAGDWRGIREVYRAFGSLERGNPPATKEAVELSRFERAIDEDEIPAGGLASTPMLAELLEEMEAVAKLDPEARLKRLASERFHYHGDTL